MTSFELTLGSTKIATGTGFSIDAGNLFDALETDPGSALDFLFQSEPVKFIRV